MSSCSGIREMAKSAGAETVIDKDGVYLLSQWLYNKMTSQGRPVTEMGKVGQYKRW